MPTALTQATQPLNFDESISVGEGAYPDAGWAPLLMRNVSLVVVRLKILTCVNLLLLIRLL